MKIAYVTNVVLPAQDAQSIQVAAMARSFSEILGDEFLLVSPRTEDNGSVQTPYTWVRIQTHRSWMRLWRYLHFAIWSVRVVRRRIVNCVYTRDIGVAAIFSLLGYTCVYEMHKPFNTRIGNRLFSIFARRLKIVAISQALKEFVEQAYHLTGTNILVAHDGVALEDFQVTKSKDENSKPGMFGVPENAFVALYTGTLQPGKGTDLIVAAARELPNVQFVIVGGTLNQALPPNVRCVGRQPHNRIPIFLQTADVLLLPNNEKLSYFNYTSPLKLFEYMASGTPVVATGSPSILEILDPTCAWLVNTKDTSELVKAIQEIQSNKSEANARAVRARERVRNYTWQARAKQILDFISR